MESKIFHKDELVKLGIVKSKQKEGATLRINNEIWKILHICKNKDYRVLVKI